MGFRVFDEIAVVTQGSLIQRNSVWFLENLNHWKNFRHRLFDSHDRNHWKFYFIDLFGPVRFKEYPRGLCEDSNP